MIYLIEIASLHIILLSERQALYDWGLWTMSGGEPSSIKQYFWCDAVSLSFTYLYDAVVSADGLHFCYYYYLLLYKDSFVIVGGK